ncbi:MAG: BatA domain-containing protein, partial [Hyphomicrobiales bacterium]
MLGLGTLTFATPLALGALALLPVIWWLLRFTPPRPQAVRFPPFRLLRDLVSREEQPDRTPWWLLLLRLAIVTLVILAVARPLLVHDEASGLTSERLLVVIDDGWAAARQWPERERMLGQFIDAAERARAPVALAGTAPRAQPSDLQFLPAGETREVAAAIVPKALETDRLALLERLEAQLDDAALQVVWLADGLDSEDAQAFAEGLQGLGNGRSSLQVVQTQPSDLGLSVGPPTLRDGDVHVTVTRPSTAAADTALLRMLASNGRSLAERPVVFDAGADTAETAFSLPLELRNEAARLEIAEERTAAGVYLFDDQWRRKTVGLVSGASQELDQPLLSPLYYVSRALEPTSELREADGGGVGELLEQTLSMLVVADVGIIAREQRQQVEQWVDGGGVLVRFAGPRLAGGNDDLVPVELRTGDRTLGSALAWEQPQP